MTICVWPFVGIFRGRSSRLFVGFPTGSIALPISEDEVKLLFEATSNIKHLCLMYMLYSSGLRVSELLRLKWGVIDADRMVVYIRGAKGQKDRISILSRVAYVSLQHYMDLYKPATWLFESPGGGQYGATNVNKVIYTCADRARIKKHVSAHTLRHHRLRPDLVGTHRGRQFCNPFAGARHRLALYSDFTGP